MFGSKKKSKKEDSKEKETKKKLEKKDSKEGKVKDGKDKSSKDKSSKDSKSKSGKENKNGSDKKRNSGENQDPGYSWSPRDMDKPKYGPHNLNLFHQRPGSSGSPNGVYSSHSAFGSTGSSSGGGVYGSHGAPGSTGSPAGGGVYGSHSPMYNGYGEHRVHHSVVNISNDPAPRQAYSGVGSGGNYNKSELAHPFFRRQDVMDPEEIRTETVNHYQISQGNETKHVTSINVNSKTSVHLGDDDKPGAKNIIVSDPRGCNHCSQCGSHKTINTEQSYVQRPQQMGNSQCNHHMPQFPQGTVNKVPVVLAEVNIPERIVNGQRPDSDRVQYAELMFNKKPLQRSSSYNSLKEEKCNTVKGILKQPKSAKRVEFNKEVDVNLFNTLSTLSRHESLESLSIFDQHAVARDHQMMQKRHQRAAPLDDTDLYMYTLRRNRCGPAKWPAYGSMAWRQPPAAQWMPPNPWAGYRGCKANVPYKQQSMRTLRMMPTNGPDRHYYW